MKIYKVALVFNNYKGSHIQINEIEYNKRVSA